MTIAHLIMVLFCGLSAEPTPTLEVVLQKPTDKATVRFKEERAVIAIESKAGIGRAEIKPPAGKWPKSITLSLGLKDLEGFYAENDALRIQASLKHDNPEVSVSKPGGERKQIPAEERHGMSVKRVGERIEVELPAVLFSEGIKSIRVQWIDYNR